MADLRKNVLLTGVPSSGKTTVIRKVIALLRRPATGFYTREERVAGQRAGFVMKTLDGREGYLAHRDIPSDFRVRIYGVSMENIETIAVPSLAPRNDHVIVIDEIGKMECFSHAFRTAVLTALDSPNIVVGTISLGGDEFFRRIKGREDVEILEVTPKNRDSLPDVIVRRVARILEGRRERERD